MNSLGAFPPPVSQLRMVPSACRWKVGLDLGACTTVYQELHAPPHFPATVSCSALPTVLACSSLPDGVDPGRQGTVAIGQAALQRRDHMDLVSPFAIPAARRLPALLQFARALRQHIARGRPGWPWGVLACPGGADAEVLRELRAAASELFERFLLVEEPLLWAHGALSDPVGQRALLVDIGATGVRASAVGGASALPGRRHQAPVQVKLPQGGAAVDERLKTLLLQKYSDLVLTDVTITRLKDELGFVAPAERTVQLKVVLGRTHRVLEVSDMVREACESMVPLLLEAIREVLARARPEETPALLANILLAGGGARAAGLPERIQAELASWGFDRTRVRTVKDPGAALALGALKWGLLTPDDPWEVPVFAFRPAV